MAQNNQVLDEYLKTQQSNAEMELKKQQFKAEMALKKERLEFEKQKAEFEQEYSRRLLDLEQKSKVCPSDQVRGFEFSEFIYAAAVDRAQAAHGDWEEFKERISKLSYALAPADSSVVAYDSIC